MRKPPVNTEQRRLAEAEKGIPWKKWGPYLSERQWGTVREDYSQDGNAWSYFPHDHARSRAYRWGEDGLAGFSDEKQRLCFAVALWNGQDPILKERLFGLANSEGNHGEDVKEYCFYLDSTPTHSYLKWLYKHPQAAFPYADLVETNRGRTRLELEYELLDTGVFTDDRYFDIGVEYAKATPEDILVRISMPDKWEYPWYAAWDLAFHTIALSTVDLDFAKQQLDLMLTQMYIHPNGQIPAYEWNFSDVNPPVHAWATLSLYRTEQAQRGEGDLTFLKRAFGGLLTNFTWWVNRKDRFGKNVFEGGFLGLDNIGVFDRSAPLPTGGHLEQADGTAWMAFFSQNMLELASEIAVYDPSYDDLAAKFVDHLLWIAHAVNHVGSDGPWDEEDGFYYDVLRLPDGTATRLKVRSVVGLLPLCATSVSEPWMRDRIPGAMKLFAERNRRTPELLKNVYEGTGYAGRCSETLRSSSPTRIGETTSCSTSISTAIQVPASVRVTRPDGPASWPRSSKSSATSTPPNSWSKERRASFSGNHQKREFATTLVTDH